MWHIYCEKLSSIKICICSFNATFTLVWRKKNCSLFWQAAGATAGKYFCGKWQCSTMEMGQTSLTCSCLPPSDQQSNCCLHQSDVQQLQAALLEDLAELSQETSLAWLRENWQNWLDSSKTLDLVTPGLLPPVPSKLSPVCGHSPFHQASHQALQVLRHTQVDKNKAISRAKPNKRKITAETGKMSWDRGGEGVPWVCCAQRW